MPQQAHAFTELSALTTDIRSSGKKVTLLFAYNGKGKTRLSMEFKKRGKLSGAPDTLYFNAFTQDLFRWNNDLDNDSERYLGFIKESRFFTGLKDFDIENRVRSLVRRYCTINFRIDLDEGTVTFFREELVDGTARNIPNIKVSRGEENIFYWCFFLAIAQLAIEKVEAYTWVKYLYVDDPISSLDDNNAIAVAHHLAKLVKSEGNELKTVVSTHHALFFNVLCNEFKNGRKLFLQVKDQGYLVKETNDTPFIYHVAMIQEMKKAIEEDKLYTYHFSLLRNILEKAANFHGFSGFDECMVIDTDDDENTVRTRMVNIMNHGGYSLFEPVEMVPENKEHFKQIFNHYLENYKFNPELFVEPVETPLA